MADAAVTTLRVEVVADEADPSELDRATRRLREEVSRVDGIDAALAAAAAPAGAKSAELALTGQLLLTLIGSGGVAVAMVSILKDWLNRHRGFKLRLKHGNDEIEVSGLTPTELTDVLQRVQQWVPEAKPSNGGD